MEPLSKIEIKTKSNIGKRIYAGIIDYSIILLFCGIMFYFYGEQTETGYALSGIPMLTVILFWGIITIGLEQIFGATIGNYMTDLKPISIMDYSNSKLSFGQSVKRHLLDIIDLWPFGLIGILLIKNTKYNQRLGDIWAKTIVIDLNDSEQGVK